MDMDTKPTAKRIFKMDAIVTFANVEEIIITVGTILDIIKCTMSDDADDDILIYKKTIVIVIRIPE